MPVGAFLTRISVGLTLLLFLSVAQAAEKAPKRLLLDDFEGEVARRWQNLTASTNPVKAGKGAARWTGVDASNLKLPHDWSAYKTWNLSLWCHAEKATGARFLVMLASDSPKGDGPDFFYLPVTVDWKGWKEIRTAAALKSDLPVGHGVDAKSCWPASVGRRAGCRARCCTSASWPFSEVPIGKHSPRRRSGRRGRGRRFLPDVHSEHQGRRTPPPNRNVCLRVWAALCESAR